MLKSISKALEKCHLHSEMMRIYSLPKKATVVYKRWIELECGLPEIPDSGLARRVKVLAVQHDVASLISLP